LEAFYNKQQNQYIFTTNRTGSRYLNSITVKNLGWEKVDLVEPELDKLVTISLQDTTKIIKVVRDPYERWQSWFNTFVLTKSNIDWNIDQSNQWLADFKKTLSKDFHTEKQSILLNSINTGSSQIIYIHMEDLNIFLKISDQRHVINYCDKFETLPEGSRKLFFFKIKKIYNEDYKWIKTLSFLKF
jgi:hypothetical protein